MCPKVVNTGRAWLALGLRETVKNRIRKVTEQILLDLSRPGQYMT